MSGVYGELFGRDSLIEQTNGLVVADTVGAGIGLVSAVGKRSAWHRILGLYDRTNRGLQWGVDGTSATFPSLVSELETGLAQLLLRTTAAAPLGPSSLYGMPACREYTGDPADCYLMVDKKALLELVAKLVKECPEQFKRHSLRRLCAPP